MEESLHFYRDVVGLPLIRRFPAGPGAEIAFLGDGETKLELIFYAAQPTGGVGPDISWGFEVDSLDDCMAALKEKGIPVIRGPIQPNPHARFIFVKDPNGLNIQFVENK
jgi:lactoylglutathione lyase